MEDRNREVQIGAGLQESRLNTDFIAWLQKWGPRALYVLLAIVLGYIGVQRYGQWQMSKIDGAFADLDAARNVGDPDGLLEVAAQHDGRREVWTLATLDAANVYLRAARRGMTPDAAAPPTDDQILSMEQREAMAQRAEELLQSVIDRIGSDPNRARFAMRARWGLVSSAMDKGDVDGARTRLTALKEEAGTRGFTVDEELAQRRLDSLDLITGPVVVLARADLPESAVPPEGVTPGPPVNTLPPGIRRVDPGQMLRLQEPPSTGDEGEDAPAGDDAASDVEGEADGGDAPANAPADDG
ncbi:MAG: hypothetical protein AAFX05_14640 [Planctomycetota bacterium]